MYIDYFTNRGGSPNLDQGVIYFYIISLFLNNSKNLINPNNQELIYNNSNFEQRGLIIATSNRKNHKEICSQVKKIIEEFNIYPLKS